MRRSTLLSLASPLLGAWAGPVASSGPLASLGTVALAAPALAVVAGAVDPLAAQDHAAPGLPTSSPGEWPAWSRPLLLIGGLALFDRPVRRASHRVQGGIAADVAGFGRWYGDWRASAPFLLGGTLAVAVAREGNRGWGVGAAVTLGVLAGSFLNEGMNVAVGRDRPNAGDGPWRFDPFSGHASFPSGHTALAFAFAGAVDEATAGWAPAAAAYAAAALTGASRVYDDKHWATDVAAGALVGAVTARLVTRFALGRLGRDGRAGGRESGADAPASPSTGWSVPPAPRIEPIATLRLVGLRLVH